MRVSSAQRSRRMSGQGGQGTVEYILILVVTSAVILGAVYQLNSAFRVFADNYFGDYLACLLEAGELPALGGSVQGVCNQEFEDFSIANGVPLVGSGVQEGQSQGGDASSEDGDESVTARGGSRGGSSNRFAAGTSSGGANSGRPRRFAARRSAGAAASGDGSETGGDTGSASVTSLSGYQSGKAVRIPVRDAQGLRGGRRVTKKEDEKDKTTKVSAKKDSDGIEQRQVLIPIQRKLAAAQDAPEIEEFTFGNILRYLIIAIIIIAIVVVVGGEARQVSKSIK